MLSSRRVRRSVWVTLALLCTGVVAVYGELSAQALVTVTATGTVFTAVGLARRTGKGADRVGRQGLAWSVWLMTALVWEVSTLRDDTLPTLSDLMDPVLAHPVPRGTATACWLAVGAWLLTRPAHRDASR